MAKAKKKAAPKVSSVAKRISSTIYNNGVDITSLEETDKRKRKLLGIFDSAIDKIAEKLNNNEIELNSTLDMERVAKCALLLSGEATNINGSTNSVTMEAEAGAELKNAMSKAEKILDDNDPVVLAMYEKLYRGYNDLNDEENKKRD